MSRTARKNKASGTVSSTGRFERNMIQITTLPPKPIFVHNAQVSALIFFKNYAIRTTILLKNRKTLKTHADFVRSVNVEMNAEMNVDLICKKPYFYNKKTAADRSSAAVFEL